MESIKRAERIRDRIRERKVARSNGSADETLPASYFMQVSNFVTSDDPVGGTLTTVPDKFTVLWRLLAENQRALLRSDGGDGTAVGKLWGASLLLPYILSASRSLSGFLMLHNWIEGKCVAELGAGWGGAPGVASYLVGASRVLLTDGEEGMVQCLVVNAASAMLHRRPDFTISAENSLSSFEVSAHILRWGNQADAENILSLSSLKSCDVAVIGDCVYDTTSVASLVETVSVHLSCPRVVLCWETRIHRLDAEEDLKNLFCAANYHTVLYSRHILDDLMVSSDVDAEVCSEIRNHLDNTSGDLNFLLLEKIERGDKV